jgi:hypothetical protein
MNRSWVHTGPGINARSYSKISKSSWSWWLTPIILITQEAEIRRITVCSQSLENSLRDPISIIPNTERACGGAQVVERLPSLPETLSSSSNAAKKIINQKGLGNMAYYRQMYKHIKQVLCFK